MPNPVLTIEAVDFAYGAVPVLFGLNLTVMEGEIFALLGPNGAGKTTTLRVVAGLETVQRGAVHLLGEDVTGRATEERAQRGLGVVFGGRAVFGDLTVDANLSVSGQMLRAPQLLAERIDEAYAIFPRLKERSRSLAVQLSGGEQQMLALAKAFILRPRLLCIDELSMGLAPTIVSRLLEVLRQFRASGITILLVEQSARVAAEVADRAGFMERGEILHVGTASDVLDDATLHALYLKQAAQ